MSVEAPKLIPSGIEPVDKLLGGLESQRLYIAYGDDTAPALFGIKFLIEGLKQKEPVALVTHHPPEEAMRQFARLGYDCLEDVQKGKLVILEYSERVIEQVSRLSKLTPILKELEWWFKEAQPRRFLFDSISSLIPVADNELKPRAREFAVWASSFAATVLLVDSDKRNPVIKEFLPFVKESFRLESQGSGTKTGGTLVFEKSTNLPDQAIEIDVFRGLFLLNHPEARETAATEDAPPTARPAVRSVDKGLPATKTITDSAKQAKTSEPIPDYSIVKIPAKPEAIQTNSATDKVSGQSPAAQSEAAKFVEVEIGIIASTSETVFNESTASIPGTAQRQTAELLEPNPQAPTHAAYDFSDFVAELDVEIGEFDLSKLEPTGSSTVTRKPRTEAFEERGTYLRRASDVVQPPPKSEAAVTSTTAQMATEKTANLAKPQTSKVDSKNFNVAVIDYDIASCGRIAKALNEFKVEIYKDALSGIAGIIASPPDLVVLDVDAPIVDGFKVLAHLRASLPVPIIALSKFHLRASDRILSAELGADYYLTKPFSSKELQRKARQLIARYRGVNSWIATPMALAEALSVQTGEFSKEWLDKELEPAYSADFKNILPKSKKEKLEPYTHFILHVEERVKTAIAEGTVFSMVGFRLEPNVGSVQLKAGQLFDLVGDSVRTDDLISTNTRNDLVVLLPDTNTQGARGFVKRLRKQIAEEVNEDLTVWIRNFPNLEEAYQLLSLKDAGLLDEQSHENSATNSARA